MSPTQIAPVEPPDCLDIEDDVCRAFPGCRGCPADGAPVPPLWKRALHPVKPPPWGGLYPVKPLDEIRVIDPVTGGEKGDKLARYDLIPVGPLRDVARLYGRGAKKYAERNWERGYQWHLSYAALQRHLNAFWDGEEFDGTGEQRLLSDGTEEADGTGLPHLAAVAWHALALMEFTNTYPEGDDRPLPRATQIYSRQ